MGRLEGCALSIGVRIRKLGPSYLPLHQNCWAGVTKRPPNRGLFAVFREGHVLRCVNSDRDQAALRAHRYSALTLAP